MQLLQLILELRNHGTVLVFKHFDVFLQLLNLLDNVLRELKDRHKGSGEQHDRVEEKHSYVVEFPFLGKLGGVVG